MKSDFEMRSHHG